jgi:hypothetical protein
MQTKGGIARSNPRPARVTPTNLPSVVRPRTRLPHEFVRPTPPLAYLIYALALSTPPRTPSPTNWPFPKVPPFALTLSHARASRHLSLASICGELYFSLPLSRSFTSLRLSLAPTRNRTLSSLPLPRSFTSPRDLAKSYLSPALPV